MCKAVIAQSGNGVAERNAFQTGKMREGLSTNSGNALADGNGLGKCLVGIPRSVGFGSIVGHCAGTGDGQVVTGVDSPVDGVVHCTGGRLHFSSFHRIHPGCVAVSAVVVAQLGQVHLE